MNQYDGLLKQISSEFHISKGEREKEDSWKARIIYSLLGQIALSSLFDSPEYSFSEQEQNETVSEIQMKNKISEILNSYISIYPEMRTLMPLDATDLYMEIKGVYIKTGVVYHEPYRFVMAAETYADCGGIRFTRGYPLETSQKISGLGSYQSSEPVDQNDGVSMLTDMFQLNELPLLKQWEVLISQAHWRNTILEDGNTEYLLMDPPFTRGYWSIRPNTSGKISILRTGLPGSHIYYLYYYQDGQLFVSQLPGWQCEEHEYRTLSNACLKTYKTLPPTKYDYDGDIVHMRFEYLPPPAELNLWKLYTWPESLLSLPSDFNRICARGVFDVLRDIMETQGYIFEERSSNV